jgi:hypothetical protein
VSTSHRPDLVARAGRRRGEGEGPTPLRMGEAWFGRGEDEAREVIRAWFFFLMLHAHRLNSISIGFFKTPALVRTQRC